MKLYVVKKYSDTWDVHESNSGDFIQGDFTSYQQAQAFADKLNDREFQYAKAKLQRTTNYNKNVNIKKQKKKR